MSKRIAIYGATSAIAIGAAKTFAKAGATLHLIARNKEKLEAVVADLSVIDPKVRLTQSVTDLSDTSTHEGIASEAIAKMGGCDAILIAHGELGDQAKAEFDFKETERLLEINFLSVVSILTRAAKYFSEQRSGTVAVISSVAGDRGRQSNFVYGTAKGALSIYLQGLRNRLYRDGVRILTIKPGFVDSPMTAHLKKGALWAQPQFVGDKIAQAVLRDQGADVIYLPGFWRIIMAIIRSIPESIFKRMKL